MDKFKSISSRSVVYLLSFAIFIRFNEQLFHMNAGWRLYLFYPALCIAGLTLFRSTFLESWRELMARPWRIAATIAGCFVLNLVLATIVYTLQGDGGGTGSANDQQVVKVMREISPFVTLPVLGILGVIVEEIVFRHILIGRLSEVTGTKWAIWACMVLSAVLFGFYHMRSAADMASVPIYVASGLSFGIAYVVSGRNILTTIIWHSGNNLLALAGILATR